jgi:hypothetical protein
MSDSNYFVIWKGVKSGPYAREQLEAEFSEGRMGLVRTVLSGSTMIPARDFVSDLETIRREEQLVEQLRQEKQRAERDRLESNRREEQHLQQLEETSQRPAGKTTPPPIPDINPWAPQRKEASRDHSNQTNTAPKDQLPLVGKFPLDHFLLPAGCFFCAITFISGNLLREGAALAALGFGISLLVRRRITTGIIMIAVAVCAYGLGLLLTDLIHDYMTKNYPH